MPQSALTKKLINDGLPKGPVRTLAELLAEHRALVAFAISVRDAAPGRTDPAFRLEARLLVDRCAGAAAKDRAA